MMATPSTQGVISVETLTTYTHPNPFYRAQNNFLNPFYFEPQCYDCPNNITQASIQTTVGVSVAVTTYSYQYDASGYPTPMITNDPSGKTLSVLKYY
jgi:hypothetical protein